MAVSRPASAPTLETAAQLHRAPVEAPKAPPAKAPKIVEAQKQADTLRQFEAEHKDPREVVQQSRDRSARPLTPTELANLKKVDPKQAEQAERFNTYSEVMAEAKRTGKPPAEVAKAKGTTDFDKTRDAVEDQMRQLPVFQDMEGFRDMTPAEQRAFVEESFGTNDRVRAIYLTQMREVSRDAMTLPEDQKTKTSGETAQRTTERSAQRKATIDRMRARLKATDQDLSDTQVEAMFKSGQTPEEARLSVMDALLEKKGINPTEYHAHQEAQAADARLAELQNEFQDAHKKGPHAGNAFDLDGFLSGNSADKRVQEYKQLQQRKAQIAKIPSTIQPDQETTIEEVKRAVYGKMDFDAGQRVGGIDAELQAIHQNMTTETQVSPNQIFTPEQQQLQQEREQRIVALQEKMEKALSKSVEDTLIEQIDETRDIMERKTLAEQADKEEGEKTLKDKATSRMVEQQNHNWIGMDKAKGNRTINYDQIGSDARYIAREGEDGVKRLILRDMMMGGEGAIVKMSDENGQPLTMNPEGKLVRADGSVYNITVQQRGESGQYSPVSVPATWENVPYESLPEEGRNVLNTLQQEQGDAYATRLVMDLEQARHPHSLGERWKVLGKLKTLNLSRDEITAIHTKLGDVLEKGVQQARDADHILDRLAAQGVDVTASGSKTLIGLLVALGLGGIPKIPKREN
ncbi:MAG: hypothetical protein V1922_05845 [bacterium]